MRIEQWWPRVPEEAREWLAEHNGEPLSAAVLDAVVRANGGETDPSWWAGTSHDGEADLTDEAVDWIEAVSNGEH